MNPLFRSPGGMRAWNAVLMFIMGCLQLWLASRGGGSKLIAVLGAIFVVSAFGLWARARWARWTGAAVLLVTAALAIIGMALKTGFRWSTSLTTLLYIWIGWELLTDSDRKIEGEDEAKKDEPEKPLTSFVLLLSGARQATAAQLAIVVTRAWGGTYGFQDEADGGRESENWVVGRSPIFLIKSPEAMFMLHNFPTPYTSDAKEMAQAIPDLRLRKAIEDHRAWIAVDLLHPFDAARTTESFYPAIAKLIAELAGDDCLAVFHPESQRINAWDDSLKEALRGPEPLKNFAKVVNPPVLRIDDQDPDLLAGKEEARRRLPEFLEAFRVKNGEHFSVKAPVTAGGRTEHIWIEIDEVHDDRVGGKLGNEPVNLGGMKLGDRVDVALSEVEDWVIVRNGEPLGVFTARAVGKNLKRP